MIIYDLIQIFVFVMDILFSIIGLSLIIIALINIIYSHFYKVVNMPSMPQTRRMIIDNIQKHHGDCDGLVIYDLGSGWGGLCRKLSNNFPKASVKGFEISPIPFLFSKIVALFGRYMINRQDIFKMNLNDADIIVCYLSHYHINKLMKKIDCESTKNIIIYSQGFPAQGLEPDGIIDIPYSIEKKLYRYDIKK